METQPIPGADEKRILWIDDHEVLARLACEILEMQGFHTQTAYSVAQALELLETERFDLLVTGCNNQRRDDGVDLANEVRRRWPTVPIIMATGHPPEVVPASVDVLLLKDELFPRALEEICRLLKLSAHA